MSFSRIQWSAAGESFNLKFDSLPLSYHAPPSALSDNLAVDNCCDISKKRVNYIYSAYR